MYDKFIGMNNERPVDKSIINKYNLHIFNALKPRMILVGHNIRAKIELF
jgi:hypothetical protein